MGGVKRSRSVGEVFPMLIVTSGCCTVRPCVGGTGGDCAVIRDTAGVLRADPSRSGRDCRLFSCFCTLFVGGGSVASRLCLALRASAEYRGIDMLG